MGQGSLPHTSGRGEDRDENPILQTLPVAIPVGNLRRQVQKGNFNLSSLIQVEVVHINFNLCSLIEVEVVHITVFVINLESIIS